MHSDSVKSVGDVRIQFVDTEGRIINELREKNLVVQSGLNYIASCLISRPPSMNWMAIGNGNIAPALNQTSLGNELARVVVIPDVVSNVTRFDTQFGEGVGTGVVSELGIFNNANPGQGVMLARVTFAPQTKESTTRIIVSWHITQS